MSNREERLSLGGAFVLRHKPDAAQDAEDKLEEGARANVAAERLMKVDRRRRDRSRPSSCASAG